MIRAGLYARVSTEEQVEGYSLDAQRRAFKILVEGRGWEIYREYVEEGKSAHTDDSSGPHHQDSGEAKIRESTAGVSRKPSSDCKACGCSSKHLCGLTAWNT